MLVHKKAVYVLCFRIFIYFVTMNHWLNKMSNPESRNAKAPYRLSIARDGWSLKGKLIGATENLIDSTIKCQLKSKTSVQDLKRITDANGRYSIQSPFVCHKVNEKFSAVTRQIILEGLNLAQWEKSRGNKKTSPKSFINFHS